MDKEQARARWNRRKGGRKRKNKFVSKKPAPSFTYSPYYGTMGVSSGSSPTNSGQEVTK